jgi:LmbE family N-acetylglucosaminyl deacetylase
VPADARVVLLVVAPHPDDETLCCGGIMQRVLQQGGRVSVVWLSSGDGSALGALLLEHRLWPDAQRMRAYGMRRMGEARAASAALGVEAAGQLFLGYPDGGLLAVLDTPEGAPYRSPFTAATAVPYLEALFPGHSYSGASLARDFAAVLARVQPTLVLAPSPLDAHPDHRAAGLLALRSVADHPAIALQLWIVHGGEGWPSPRALMPGIPLTPPPRGAALQFRPFTLSIAEEDTKLAALQRYATQLQVMSPFLLAFIRSTELFAPAPARR